MTKDVIAIYLNFFLQEREFRHIKFLPEILNLQKRLVRKYQNATEDIVGSIREFIDRQTGADYIDLNLVFLWKCKQLIDCCTNLYSCENQSQNLSPKLIFAAGTTDIFFSFSCFISCHKNVVTVYLSFFFFFKFLVTVSELPFSEMSPWYQKHIETFLNTWNQLRVSMTGSK